MGISIFVVVQKLIETKGSQSVEDVWNEDILDDLAAFVQGVGPKKVLFVRRRRRDQNYSHMTKNLSRVVCFIVL